MLNLHYPERQTRTSKKAIAHLFTPEGHKIFYVKIIYTKFFLIKNYGIFEIDQSKGIRYGKTIEYFFDSRSAKPLDMRVMKELQDFAQSNKLNKITRKDVRHGVQLRHYIDKGLDKAKALMQLADLTKKRQHHIDETVDQINAQAETIESPLPESDRGFLLVESLVRSKLISQEEADILTDKLDNDTITFPELIQTLRDMEIVNIQSPFSPTAQLFVDDYHTYSPAEVDVLIDRAEMIGEKMKKRGSPEVKNFVNAALVFALIVGGAIALMVLSSSDLSNLLPFLDKEVVETAPVAATLPPPEITDIIPEMPVTIPDIIPDTPHTNNTEAVP